MLFNLGKLLPVFTHFLCRREDREEEILTVLQDVRYHTDVVLIAQCLADERVEATDLLCIFTASSSAA